MHVSENYTFKIITTFPKDQRVNALIRPFLSTTQNQIERKQREIRDTEEQAGKLESAARQKDNGGDVLTGVVNTLLTHYIRRDVRFRER